FYYVLANKQFVVGYRTTDLAELSSIIFVPDMLNHTHAHYPIESTGDFFSVIAQLDIHVQAATPLLGVTELLSRDCHTNNLTAIVAGSMPSESTPTAADIEQTQTGLQTKTVANPV